MVIGISRLL